MDTSAKPRNVGADYCMHYLSSMIFPINGPVIRVELDTGLGYYFIRRGLVKMK